MLHHYEIGRMTFIKPPHLHSHKTFRQLHNHLPILTLILQAHCDNDVHITLLPYRSALNSVQIILFSCTGMDYRAHFRWVL
jgi:hypothetical protein